MSKTDTPDVPLSHEKVAQKLKMSKLKAAAAIQAKKRQMEANSSSNQTATAAADGTPKRRVRWADHNGRRLVETKLINGINEPIVKQEEEQKPTPISWSDKRKRDRMKEREMLANAKSAKIVTPEDKQVPTKNLPVPMGPWHAPRLLQLDPNNAIQVSSSELSTQSSRMAAAVRARYLSEEEVPNSPADLTSVEVALDLAGATSITTTTIPFWTTPQPVAMPPPAPVAAVQPAAVPFNQPPPPPPPAPKLPPPPPPAFPPQTPSGASPELVQSMGLPSFLVGSNVQALQTLTSSPGLLQTFMTPSGVYDQIRLMSLVQTLAQNMTPVAAATPPIGVPSQSFAHTSQTSSHYVPASTKPVAYAAPQMPQTASFLGAVPSSTYGNNNLRKNGYRGDQNNAECNLHISGYGQGTTEADIRALFGPYVRIDEIVIKSGFSFVNTSDAPGAKTAREALNGTVLGGQPIRISIAQRRNKEPPQAPSIPMPEAAPPPPPLPPAATVVVPPVVPPAPPGGGSTLPKNPLGQIDYEQIRDDRGNAATKNLFVAGYGSGTSETQLLEMFSHHTHIVGCVMKGNFAFINTADKISAIHSREALTGAVVNGGVLRINFAKESGRLGTSFDTTYNAASHTHYMRHAGRQKP